VLGSRFVTMDACAPCAVTRLRTALPPNAPLRRRGPWLPGSRAWSFLAFLVVAAAFPLARAENRYPAALAAALVFFLVQCFLPGCRPVASRPLCPWNWALFVFFLQLVLLPLSLLMFGPLPGVLPALPSDRAINLAILINIAAFLSSCTVYHFLWRRSEAARRSGVARPAAGAVTPSLLYIALNAAIGLAGLFFAFGNFGALGQYFSDPSGYLNGLPAVADKVGVAAGLFLRPFLGFALVLGWCRWLDRGSDRRINKWSGIVTLLAIPFICFSNATFHYNRGALLVPLVAMLAVMLGGPRRFPRRTLACGGAALLVILSVMPFYGAYRSSNVTLRQLATQPSAREFLTDKIDLPEMFQVYGGAPQFLAYFLEQSRGAARPTWGRVLVSSALAPVPILGKPFRPDTGTAIYNRLIYGASDIADQIAPFAGEIFLDFHLAGVLAGFCLLGWAAHKLQQAFERSKTSVEIFLWQYFAIWTFFLIFGSVSVVSQIFLYFGWPLYFYLFLHRFRSGSVLATARGRTTAALGAATGAH
jgi:hypothetical protein